MDQCGKNCLQNLQDLGMRKMAVAWVTYPEEQQAAKTAHCLVEKGLAAGVNILGPMTSVYRWKGEERTHNEWLLLAQLPEDLFAEFRAEISSCHPYETPCILLLPVQDVNLPFLQWVNTNCREK